MTTKQPVPKISVIMIFFNSERYMGEAVESVLAQTMQDWELLLVDDGSSDGSTALAKRYAATDPARIRYLEHSGHQNRGMSASRNLGISQSRGEYIAFLDSDDIWLPERLARHLEAIEAHAEVGMVYGPTLYWYSWSEDYTGPRRDHPGELFLETGKPIPPPTALLGFLDSGGGSLPGICSLLARRDVVQQVGGFEEDFRGIYEDQVFLSKMCLHTPILVLDEVLDKYRQHSGSHCHQAMETGEYHDTRPHPGRKRYLLWLDGYLKAHPPVDPRLKKSLRNELLPYRSWLHAAWHGVKKAPAKKARRVVKKILPTGVYTRLRRQSR